MSISPSAPPALFAGLLDDAAMFPPGSATPDDALKRHLEWRRDRRSELVGPLLVHSNRWAEFLAAYESAPGQLDVAVVGEAAPPAPVPAGITVVGYETVTADGTLPEPLPPGRLALEAATPAHTEELLANVGEARIDSGLVIAKFRTGGETPEAFPSEAELGYRILAAFNAGVPFKLTAGLHHATRHTDPATGFEHHGFLNVMVAVARCEAGAAEDQVADALAVRDANALAAEVGSWSPHDVVAIRTVFLSFGCCEVAEPIADLEDLGLLERADR